MLSLERRQKENFTISAIYGCRDKFRYFPPSSLSEVGIKSCRFLAAAGRWTRVSFIYLAQFNLDHKALTCKRDDRVKSWVSNERREAEIMSNFLHLNISLTHYLSSAFATGIQILGHTIYDLLNFAKLDLCNGLLPEGNWTPSRLSSTFPDYFWVIIKDALWHLTWFHGKWKILSLKCGRDQMAVILQTTFSDAFSPIKKLHFY